MNDNWLNPEEMKKLIGSIAREGDYRTLNEAVRKGTMEVKEITDRKKLYRLKQNNQPTNDNKLIDLDFSEEVKKAA